MASFVLTGASGGIGSALAHRLAHTGHELHLICRTSEGRTELEKRLSGIPVPLYYYVGDIAGSQERTKIVSRILESTSVIDWVIHAAGTITSDEQESGALEHTFTVNTYAPIALHGLLSHHLSLLGGTVFIGSTAGVWGNEHFPIYSASKAALIHFSRCIAKAWASSDRLSVAVCPGPTNTSMRDRIAGDAQSHQSPDVVVDVIEKIVQRDPSIKNGDTIIVRNGTMTAHDRI